jgi:hypothetical protein
VLLRADEVGTEGKVIHAFLQLFVNELGLGAAVIQRISRRGSLR